MKASKFSGADRVCLETGRGRRGSRRGLPEGWDQPGDVFQLEEEVCGA
jgi:hypothetical protein